MHFAALCFHFPPLRRQSPELDERTSARQRGGQQGTARDEISEGGKKEEDLNKCERQPNYFFFCLWIIRGATYLILTSRENDGKRIKRGRKWRRNRRRTERGINEGGGERRHGKAALTNTLGELKPDDGEAARSSSMRASWTATHLLYRQQRCSLITSWRDKRGEGRRVVVGGCREEEEGEKESARTPMLSSWALPAGGGGDETVPTLLPEERSWPGRRRGGKRGEREGRGGRHSQRNSGRNRLEKKYI